ncbi:BCS1 N terminal-domain-containing protein [Zopfochytrium polystomum]|nr:BCS1 N terminal-domain-containing protein [Zopfochytrium polystomum]
MLDVLANNPYFSAGFGLIGVGAGVAVLRQGALQGVSLLRRRLLVTLEIPSKDPSYTWFLQWASRNGLGQPSSSRNLKFALHGENHSVPPSPSEATVTAHQRTDPPRALPESPSSFLLKALLSPSNQLSIETTLHTRENGSTHSTFALVPAPGRHHLLYKNRAWFQIERSRERAMIDLRSGAPWETVTITGLARDKPLLLEMLAEARDDAMAAEVGKTVVFTSYGPEWRPFGAPRRRRELQSVILAEGQAEAIVGDLNSFLRNGKWYHDRGIPYRRGYLLYGPPGSGKTSFIQALAGHLDYNICVLNLSERGMTDDRLAHLLANAPPRSFILLEDIDAAFSKREASDTQGFQSMVTFSGLLNALDGVAASEERIVFMTTNHIDRLDPALIRPGRVDVKALLDNVTREQARRMFLHFFPWEIALADRFVDRLLPIPNAPSSTRPSPAYLQGLFVINRDRPENVVTLASVGQDLQGSIEGERNK